MKKKLYIACALTHAPEEFRQMIFRLRTLFQEAGFEILEFAWKDGPRHDVNIYELDMYQRLDEADVVVAVCDYPSIGLGMELERAFAHHYADTTFTRRPQVFAFAGTDMKVSKIVPDALAHYGFPSQVFYKEPEDIVAYVLGKV